MLYDDLKFVGQLATKCRNFTQKDQYLWNFSCPLCGDSTSNSRKARGYVFRHDSSLFYKCHNCGASTSFGNLLKVVDPHLYSEWLLDKYHQSPIKSEPDLTMFKDMKTPDVIDSVLDTIECVKNLPPDHRAVQYVESRKIPVEQRSRLYHAERFNEFVNRVMPGKLPENDHEDSRLVIPSINSHGKVIGVSGRSYDPDAKMRYISIKFSDPYVFGAELLNFSNPVLVIEGQIDSLFLNNCIAVQGSTFDIPFVRQMKSNVVIAMDNEPRNKQIMKQLHGYIDKGYKVCIYPDSIKEKDINKMVLSGMDPTYIQDMIFKHSYSGLEAQVRFAQWSK